MHYTCSASFVYRYQVNRVILEKDLTGSRFCGFPVPWCELRLLPGAVAIHQGVDFDHPVRSTMATMSTRLTGISWTPGEDSTLNWFPWFSGSLV